MQFSDITNNSGIVQEVDDLCDSDSVSYPLKTKARRANTALETLIGKILMADGKWDYDDTNFTDEPIGTGNLIEGQTAYSFASEYLEIKSAKVLNVGGILQTLRPLDESELQSLGIGAGFGLIPIEEYFATTGFPTHYDKLGDTIKLYPAPTATAVTLLAGLKIEFSRTGSLFAADGTDTTKVPGILSPYHILIAWMTALPYVKVYKPKRVRQLVADIKELTKDMIKFYSKRDKDDRPKRTNRRVIFR